MNKHPSHKSQTASLKRIEGQIRGIIKMVESGKYCVDVLTQIKAAKGALVTVEAKILQRHIESCIKNALKCTSNSLKYIFNALLGVFLLLGV